MDNVQIQNESGRRADNQSLAASFLGIPADYKSIDEWLNSLGPTLELVLSGGEIIPIDNSTFKNELSSIVSSTKINTRELTFSLVSLKQRFIDSIKQTTTRHYGRQRDKLYSIYYLEDNQEICKLESSSIFQLLKPQLKILPPYDHFIPEDKKKNRLEEQQYLDLVRMVLNEGTRVSNRTGIDSIKIYGASMRFSLLDSKLPLFTTKKIHYPSIVRELVWFLNGQTDSRILEEQGTTIWRDNSSKSFHERMAIQREKEGDPESASVFRSYREGDCGPLYGFNWRHFGAKYIDCQTNYKGQGVDQIQRVITQLRDNPLDRQVLLDCYDPASVKIAVLYPCHTIYHFNCTPVPSAYLDDGKQRFHLSVALSQRSADLGLGVPFNIASAALLCHLVAEVANYESTYEFIPFELYYVTFDTHLYVNHVESLQEQVKRIPYPSPTVGFSGQVGKSGLWNLHEDMIHIHGYQPHESIKMQMAI